MNEIPKNNPFKTPENYLEDFKISIGKATSGSVFTTPGDYFKEFNVELPKNARQNKVIRLHNTYRISAIAAAITLLITIPLLVNNRTNSLELDQLSFQDLDAYLQSTQNQFDHFEMASDLPEGTTDLDFMASNNSTIEDYIDLQIGKYSEINLYSDDY